MTDTSFFEFKRYRLSYLLLVVALVFALAHIVTDSPPLHILSQIFTGTGIIAALVIAFRRSQ